MIKANRLAQALNRGEVSSIAVNNNHPFHTLRYYLNDSPNNPFYVTYDKREGLVFTRMEERVFKLLPSKDLHIDARKQKKRLEELFKALAEEEDGPAER